MTPFLFRTQKPHMTAVRIAGCDRKIRTDKAADRCLNHGTALAIKLRVRRAERVMHVWK